MKTVSEYGSWNSPIIAEAILLDSLKMSEIRTAEDGVYWLEYFADLGGSRHVMHRDESGRISRLTRHGFNIRSRVHEYGGGAYAVIRNGIVFVNSEDQRVYKQSRRNEPVSITRSNAMRYADFAFDAQRNRLICVREDHSSGRYPENTLVQLPVDETSDGQVLFSGSDFVAFPRTSPDGQYLAWISWNNPSMPWNETSLWVAEFDHEGRLGEPRCINQGEGDSALDPKWSLDGSLYFISDRSGWWNLYRWRRGRTEPVAPMGADCADPPWELGQFNYGLLPDNRALIRAQQPDGDSLYLVDLEQGSFRPVRSPLATIDCIDSRDGIAFFTGLAADETAVLMEFNAADESCRVIHHPQPHGLDKRFISKAQPVEFPTTEGRMAHGYWIPPQNPDFNVPQGEKPPVIVCAHGGPTYRFSGSFRAAISFWTSRGIGVFNVNYGGSSGYGREFRKRLDGNYGVVDINDTLAAAQYLSATGMADPDRIAIKGASAGGYIVLGCLAWGNAFAAGIDYFGLSDLDAWVRNTHKHELHMLDRLLAPYPGNEDLYAERSPVNYVDRIKAPLLVLQGKEDKVVPPDQSEFIVEELEKRGMPVTYMSFEGEYHGFSKPESIMQSINGELKFLGEVFGFEVADS